MASLRLDRLTKRFHDGTDAVRDLSLTIPDGEFLVVMGPSGCGKSTLLRLIAGLEEPSEGRVWLGGEDVTATPPAQRDVAMVFQAYALYPHMTVADNLAFGLRMRGYPRRERERQVRVVAEQLGLLALLGRRPRDLSGGEQQRVALGRALIRRPKLFLLDEPLSNLDASLRGALREEIRRLHALTGTTMVHVTHDQQEALALAQRLAVMESGRILQLGTPEILYRHPAALAVARALGHPAINTASGASTEVEGRLCIATNAGAIPLPTWCRDVPLPPNIVLAVRPEQLTIGPATRPGTATLAMEIERIEGAGPERTVRLRWGDMWWTARLAPDLELPAPGATVPVTVELESAHLFDADSGIAIAPEPRR